MKQFFLLSLVALFSLNATSQTVVFSENDIRDILFTQCVKSCDEFMCRFNEEEYFPDLKMDDPKLGVKNLALLFDSQMLQAKGKELFLKDVTDFYDTIQKNHVKLSYESKSWFAELQTEFVYGKRNVKLGLILQPEKTQKKLWCWTVVGVSGMWQLCEHNDTATRLVISPEQHESEFMELESDFKYSQREFSKFRSYGTKLDSLSYFFALVENGVLKYNRRVSTTFHFLDVPSYLFDITHFNRKSSNTGWLISNIRKISQEEKIMYTNKLTSK